MERYSFRGGQASYDRLGCGSGEGTFDIARLAGPGGSVIGIDADEFNITLARKAAAATSGPARAQADAASDDLAAFTAAPGTILSGPRILQVWALK